MLLVNEICNMSIFENGNEGFIEQMNEFCIVNWQMVRLVLILWNQKSMTLFPVISGMLQQQIMCKHQAQNLVHEMQQAMGYSHTFSWITMQPLVA